MRFAVESPHLLFMPQTSLIWRHDDDDDLYIIGALCVCLSAKVIICVFKEFILAVGNFVFRF